MDCCTRIIFGGEAVIQPLFRRVSGEMVCEACSQCCSADSVKARGIQFDACQCTGSAGSGGNCIFAARFGESVSEKEKVAAREQLAKPMMADLKLQTRAAWREAIEITNLRSMAKFSDQGLLSKIRESLPNQIQEFVSGGSKASSPLPREALISSLLAWHKESFSYSTTNINVSCCDTPAKYISSSQPITQAEINANAFRVDVYQCERCRAYKRVPFSMDPHFLSESKTGDRPQGCIVFGAALAALGYEIRVCFVRGRAEQECWLEYCLPDGKDSWHHVDPFQHVFDDRSSALVEVRPASRGQGLSQQGGSTTNNGGDSHDVLDFILAVDIDYCFSDVTPLYLKDRQGGSSSLPSIIGTLHTETFIGALRDHQDGVMRRLSSQRKEVHNRIQQVEKRAGNLVKAQLVVDALTQSIKIPSTDEDFAKVQQVFNQICGEISKETLDNDSPVLMPTEVADGSSLVPKMKHALKNWPIYLQADLMAAVSSSVVAETKQAGCSSGLKLFQEISPLQRLSLIWHVSPTSVDTATKGRDAVYAGLATTERVGALNIQTLNTIRALLTTVEDYTSALPVISEILVSLAENIDAWKSHNRTTEESLCFLTVLNSMSEALGIAMFGEITGDGIELDLIVAQLAEVFSTVLGTQGVGLESATVATDVLSFIWGLEQYRDMTGMYLAEPVTNFVEKLQPQYPEEVETMSKILSEMNQVALDAE